MTKYAVRTTSLLTKRGYRKYLTERERHAFLAAAARQDMDVYLLCATVALTGCRLTEALRVRPMHVDVENRALNLTTLKQRQQGVFRQVPIPDTLLIELRRWMNLKPGCNAPIWPVHRQTGWRWLHRVMAKAGLSGPCASSRGLRHAFAIAALQANVPLNLVQKWLGHAQIETTAIYANAIGEQERAFAERAWRCLEPRAGSYLPNDDVDIPDEALALMQADPLG